MGFARRYIQKNIIYPEFVSEVVDYSLGMIVVIPVFNEPEVTRTLDSLAKCTSPKQYVEVLLVVNQSELSGKEIEAQNKRSIQDVEEWMQANSDIFFNLHLIVPPSFPKKHAGAGMARKVGMDEAIRRFSEIENEDGIIISLDADTLVESNYLVEIEKHFNANPKQTGVCLQFKHRIEEIDDEHHRKGIHLYERYLHYYKNALAYTGYPHAIHTVGSAFAVKASAYVKQGGMNRRQAGEDFYFLHKLSQVGEIAELSSTCVYPSARLSDRVPFGTGPVLKKWMDGDEKLKETYRFQAFKDLKDLFDLTPDLFENDLGKIELEEHIFSKALNEFLEEDGFLEALIEIKSNSSRIETFQKRFFQYFNAFKILKFLNFCHPEFYSFQNLVEADEELNSV